MIDRCDSTITLPGAEILLLSKLVRPVLFFEKSAARDQVMETEGDPLLSWLETKVSDSPERRISLQMKETLVPRGETVFFYKRQFMELQYGKVTE